MYLIKLKYKNSKVHNYANEYVMYNIKEVREQDQFSIKAICMSLTIARQLMSELVYRNYEENTLEYISIVELSSYEPHLEYQTLEFKEF